MTTHKKKKVIGIDKVVDFGRQLFASVLRSRTGALSELARLLRFKTGTKGFEREQNKLLPLIEKIKEAFKKKVRDFLPEHGLLLAIIDDTSVKKSGKMFPKQQKHHDHCTNSFYSGMKVLSSALYKAGKVSTINSQIVGKDDNKLEVAKQEIDMLVEEFLVDVFLFDSWYCKSPLLEKIEEHNKAFISRLRANSSIKLDEKTCRPLNVLAKQITHGEYEKVKIRGKSYWVYETWLDFKTYGELRVVFSKQAVHDEPIFLTTNQPNFATKFVVMLYLRRFAIEVFFKDAKQFLNFETFLRRGEDKWELHLLLTQILHWAIQKRNSISKIVRAIRENIIFCLTYINENLLIQQLFEELRKKCQT